jgi:hypothetical protein
MSNARLRIDGLDDFKTQLRKLVPESAEEAETFIHGRAADAVNAMAAGYAGHVRAGTLANGLSITVEHSGRYGVGVVVTNRAKHAWMFENGTDARHTAIGANRGSMPAAHVFIPEMERARRAVRVFLIELLTRQGLTVIDGAG